MKLTDLIEDIENVNQEAIIFQEDMDNPDSEIIISFAEEGDNGVKEEMGRKYHYLIEIFLAKEFLEEWKNSLNNEPTLEETAKRLFDYAVNDA